MMNFMRKAKLNKYFLFSLIFLSTSNIKIFAEGTPTLSPNPTAITGVLIAPDIPSGSYYNNQPGNAAPDDNRIYFRIGNHIVENLYYGFDFREYVAGVADRTLNLYYRIHSPSGAVFQAKWNETNNIAGSIDSYSEGFNGPNIGGVTNGYDPLSYDPTENGEYWIEFYRSGDGGANPILTSAGRAIGVYFDLTVANSSGANPRKNGRVHCDKWGLMAVVPGDFGFSTQASSEPKLYVYTDQSVILKINIEAGFKPLAYDLALNSYGVSNIGPWTTTRKSIKSTSAPSLPDGYKIFLNNPDSAYYPVAVIPPNPQFLNPQMTGCGPYNIRFQIFEPGDVYLMFDINGTPGFQPNTSDLILEATDFSTGVNSISWNGLDGLGNVVPDNSNMTLTLNYLKGRYNLPLFDAEINSKGFSVDIVAPIIDPFADTLTTMYWDDSELAVDANCLNTLNNTTTGGINNSLIGTTTRPAHAWSANGNPLQINPAPTVVTNPGPPIETNETDGTTCNDFGNGRIINTWGWGLKTAAVQAFTFKGCSDLRVVKSGPATAIAGGNITFTITATNLGISSDTNVTVTDLLPTGYTFVSATPTTGVYDDTTGIWTIGNFSNSSSAVLTIQAIVNATGNYTNSACIDGDNSDPIAPNNCSSVTPTVTVPPTVTLTGTQTIAEDAAGVATITATLSNPTTVPTVVTVAYTGTATNGTDYTPSSVTITIPANSTTGTVTIDPTPDAIFEGDETVVIDITNVTGGNGATELGTQQAIVTITESIIGAPTVTLTGTQTIAENAAGVATITATLSSPTTVPTIITVAYTGTATNGTDYVASSTTITIPANSTTGTVTINPTDDIIFEGNETVIIDITNVTGGNGATELGTQQAIVTIVDNETIPTVTLTGTQTIAENAAGVATITATLSFATTVPTIVTVTYTGTATNGTDYTPSSVTITIPAGDTTGTLTIAPIDDIIFEGNETVIIDITNVTGGNGATELGTQQAIVTIVDNETIPTVTLTGTQTIAENAAGVATITATISFATTVPTIITVAYTGTATNGTDYTPSSVTITIPAGDTTGTLTIDPIDDNIFEGNETVVIDITNVNGGNGALEFGTQQATVTIADDDSAPTVTLTGTQTIAEDAAGVATITATLSNPTTVPTVVTVAYTGTATNGTDYTPSSVTITIPANSTTGTVTIDPTPDALFEGDETVVIDITNVTGGNGATELGTQQAIVTITESIIGAPTVTLTGTQTITENAAGVATITATLSSPTTVPTIITVAYTGTATNGTDYVASSTTITIPANSTTGTVTINPTDDIIFEGNETVIIDITNVTGGNGATELGTQQAIVTIVDNETIPTVTLTGTQTIAENAAGVATITATLSFATTVPTIVTVTYTGTATNGTDYTPSSVTITIPAGDTTGTLTIAPIDDIIFEGNETVIIDITNVTGGNGATELGTQQAIVTIVDNETIPTVTLTGTQTIAENAAGVATITATISFATTVPTVVTVTYTGTATNGTDYTPSSVTITIPAGDTTGTLTIDPIDDNIFEGNETVVIDITNVTGGNGALEFGTQQATVTITDDDSAPTVTLTGTQTIAEDAAGVATITATLSNPTTVPTVVTVAYTGTATNGTDYTPSSVTITIPANSTTGTVTIDPTPDAIFEGDETVVIDITNVTGGNGATELGTQQAIVSITESIIGAPTVTLTGTQTITENAAGVATITATLSSPTTVPTIITVAYTGTATNGTDYVASSTTITIPANSTTGTVTIDPTDDIIFEGNETVIIDITNVTGGNGATELGTQQAIVTIVDNETIPTVTLTGTQTIAENAAGVATINATLSFATTVPTIITVAYTGTATNGTDYTPSSVTITIPAGDTTGTLTIAPIDDIIFEGNETVIIDITNVTGGNGTTELGTQQAIVTIVDNETIPTVTLTGTQTIAENAAGVATITATISFATTVPTVVTVTYTGTATNGTDYTPSSVTITIPAGDTTGTLTIDPIDDNIFEGNETVVIDITNVTGGNGALEFGTQQATVTITDDDSAPTVTLTGTQTIAEDAAGVATITATLSNPTTVPTVVTVAYTGTATNGTDYTPSSVTITIPANSTTGTVTIDPTPDAIFEGDETVVIDITNVTGGNGATELGTQQAIVSITESIIGAPTVTLTGTQTITENAAGVATITATLSSPTTVPTIITVAYTGTATNGTDYVASSTTITIPANSTTGTVTIDPTDDIIFEGNETVIIDITNVTGGNGATELGTQQAIVTIVDNETIPTVTLTGTQTIAENAAGVATINATLSFATTVPTIITVAYTGTATNGTDYTPSSVTITIPAGDTTGTLTIAPIDDIIFEGNETVIIDITNVTGGNGTTELGTQQAIVTIVDNETIPTVTLTGTQTIAENAAGVATITATLSFATTVPTIITVAYTGTATNGTDYTPSSVTITIPAGDTTGTLTIDPIDDNIFEGNETVVIDITNVNGGNGALEFGTQQATVTITDDETIPTFTITGNTATEGMPVTFSATLSGPSSTDTVITVVTNPGTATSPEDYNATPTVTTITIPAGSLTGTTTVTTVDDNIDETQEQFTLTGTVTSGNTLNTNATGTGTIDDNDPTPTVTLTGTTSPEGFNVTFTATLSGLSSSNVVLTVLTGNDLTPGAIQATSGLDYNPITNPVTITILAGQLTGSTTVSVFASNDNIGEQNETFALNGTVTSLNTSNINPVGIGTITDDPNDKPTVTIVGNSSPEGSNVIFTATLDNPSSTDVIISVITGNDSTPGAIQATANLDYTPITIPVTIIIPAGATTGTSTISVFASNDNIGEQNETFALNGTVTTGNTDNINPIGIGTITDDPNDKPTVFITGNTAQEGTNVIFTATLDNPSSTDVILTVLTGNDTTPGATQAIADVDYSSITAPVTITIPAGAITGSTTVNVPALVDAIFEGPETFALNGTVTSGNTDNINPIGVGTISEFLPAPTVTLTGTTSPEGSNVTFTATLSGLSSSNVVLTVLTGNDLTPGAIQATSGLDYNPITNPVTITILAGQLTGSTTVSVFASNDNIGEQNETFALNGTVTSLNTSNINPVGIGTITDDPNDKPTVTIVGNSSPEGSNVIFTATLDNPSSTDVIISVITGNDSTPGAIQATANLDYTPITIPVTIIIPAGATTGASTISVFASNDNIGEQNETFALNGTVTTGNTDNINPIGIGTITDDPNDKPTVFITGNTAQEGTNVIFTATLDNPSSTDVILTVLTSNDTTPGATQAIADVDYSSITAPVTITIPAGAITGSTTVNVPALVDAIFEGPETFALNGTVTSGNTDNINPIGVGTISEFLPAPTVTLTGTTSPEGSNVTFTATLSGLSSSNVVLTVLTGNDLTPGAIQATSGLDYNPITNPVTITILAGQLTGSTTVSVFASNDNIGEQNETFALNGTVTSLNTSNINPVGIGTITNITPAPIVTLTGTTVNEGTDVVFTATLSNPSSTDVVLTVITNPGTASNLDFTPITNPVTIIIPAGQLTGSSTVSVPTIDDNIGELTETFTLVGTVTTTNTSNTNPIGTGTIDDTINEGDFPLVTLTSTTVNEGTDVVFTATISNPSSTDVVLTVVTNPGTASNADFNPITNPVTITIPAGQLTGASTVDVPTVDDNIGELTETFTLVGTVTSPNTSNTNPIGTGTIEDTINNGDFPIVTLTGTTVNEGTDVVFTATISNPSSTDVVLTVVTNPGTASNADFNPITNPVTITIPAGQLTGASTVDVPTVDDNIGELTETFTLVGTVTSTNTSNTNPIGTGTIEDTINNGDFPIVTLTGTTVNEGTDIVFTATLSNPSSTDVVLTFVTNPGTASNADFNPITNPVTITIPAGQLTGASTVSVPTVDDNIGELTETFTLVGTVISTNTSNTNPIGTGTIEDTINNGDFPLVTLTGTTVNEGTDVVFTATLSNPSSTDVVLTVVTNPGTASNIDFTPITNPVTITIPAGQLTGASTVDVPTVDDNIGELTETFTLVGTVTSTNTSNTNPTGTGTIEDTINNGDFPLVTLTGTTVNEGTDVVFTATLSNPSSTDVVLTVVTNPGTASNIDFTPITNPVTITIPAGQLTGSSTVSVPTVDDNIGELTETFTLVGTVTTTNTSNTNPTGTGTIDDTINEGDFPSVTLTGTTVNEGTDVVFTATLSNPSSTDVVLTVITNPGTASNIDFTPITNPVTITIPAGQLTGSSTVSVPTVDDNIGELTETFTLVGTVTTTNTSNTNPTGTGTIDDTINEGDFPLVTLTGTTVNEGTDVVFTATLSNPSSTDVVLTAVTNPGTASNIDFTPITNPVTITIPAGQLTGSSTVSVPTIDDNIGELTETFTLVGTVTTTNTSNTNPIGTGTIDDTINEGDFPSVTLTGTTVNEGTDVVFTATLSNPSSTDVVLTVITNPGTASNIDFTPITNPVTITIPAGQLTGSSTVSVPTVDDNIGELTETFTLVGTVTTTNTSNTNPTGTGTIDDTINEGDFPLVTLTGTTVNEGTDVVFTATLSNPSSTDVVLTAVTNPGTASNIDFTPITNPVTITIPAGQLTGSSTVSVPTIDDNIGELTETFTLVGTVTTTNTSNTNPIGTGTIDDNEATIIATNDSYNVECSKFVNLGNILSNDSIDGTIATTSSVGGLTPNVALTILSGLTPFINIDPLANISVQDGIPFGTYPIQYQICELGNLLNCVTATVTITVEDTTQPVITNVPEAISYQCIDEVPVAGNLTAIDNCAGSIIVTGVDTTDNTDPCNIIITRTWTFSDGTNSTQVSQTITVHDTTVPVFIGNLPDNDEVECSDAIPVGTVQAIDNCSAAPINATYTDSALVPNTSGDCTIKGTIDRVWRATDACGNFVEYTQTFTIVDTTKPTVDASFQTTIEATCDAIPTVITPIFSDNCSTTVNTISFTEVPGDTSSDGKYTITRTWVVSDGCNEETFVQLVNVTITDYLQEIVVPMDCNLENIDIKLYDKIKELYPAMTIETGGKWTDESGLLGDSFDATLGTFNPYQVPVGDYTIKYEVTTDPDCPKSVLIDLRVDNDCSVDDCQTLTVHNAFSPNNDGDNEQFIIDGITTECYKNNTIEIYNRWGVLVFDADNYDNETNVFKGISGGRATIKKSEELPSGTYFYILKHKSIDGNSYTRQGYLYLTR